MRPVTFALALIALCFQSAPAEYLEVSRSATLKAAPDRSADVVDRLDVGTRLNLVDGNQVNGYYHAVYAGTSHEGYVYRTFVRRFADDLPATIASRQFATQELTPAFFDLGGEHMYSHFIDIGQGLSVAVEFPCGVILIDAGFGNPATAATVVDYLHELFQSHRNLPFDTIAAIIVTHNHYDHTAALEAVFATFTVLHYVDNGEDTDRQADVRDYVRTHRLTTSIHSVAAEDIPLTGLTGSWVDPVDCAIAAPRVRLLSGRVDATSDWWTPDFDNENNQSVVVRVDFGESSLLFPGDLQHDGIDKLLQQFNGTDLLDVDVYQVGHHGSHNATTQEFLQAMSPELAICSMGDPQYGGSRSAYGYGHPNKGIIEMLSSALQGSRLPAKQCRVATKARQFTSALVSRPIWGTGWDGTVVVSADLHGNLKVATAKPGSRPHM